ncbi:MAG: hypothetical protein M3521_14930 [Acidobacteriota bacterium]|nr:hypothetical protein [Acidobacteriota bacterium]
MEEIINNSPATMPAPSTVLPAKTKPGWKEWFGTEEAIRWVYLIFGFFVIVLLMVLLQFSTQAICCGDWDGYYHIKWSSLLWENFRQGRWLPDFTWLPLTVLNQKDYADHHFLFHLLQIPFLWFFEPVMAAKIAAVFYGSLAIFSVYWLMFRYQVDYLLLWLAALLTCANSFFFRMNMAKAPPLTIIYTIAGIYLLFERKYVWLLPLMFVFVWTYSLFPMLFIAAFIWTLIVAWNERRFEWRPVAYTFGGMVLGNVINPYFPQNIWLFVEHFLEKFKVGDFAVAVGGEWYPYSGVELLLNFPVAFTAMLIGYILFAPRSGKLPEKSTFLLMFVTVLLVSQFRSKRFAEYFPPFAILFAAISWRDFLISNIQSQGDSEIRTEAQIDSNKKSKSQKTYEIIKEIGVWTLGVILVLWMFYNIAGINLTRWFNFKEDGLISNIQSNEPNDKYRRAMTWANENIPEGERIFNCNWDDFPKLFFLDTKHNYVYGLDPNYLYTKNPEIYKLIGEITSGKVEDPAPVIREKFGANFVMSDAKENEDFIKNCLESGWCEMVYEDDEARILKIRDQKGEPPNDEEQTDASETTEEKEQSDEENQVNQTNINQTTNDKNEEN